MIEGYITTKEAAEKLGVSQGRIRQLVATGKLPAQKVGQTNLVKENDLQLVENRQTGRPAAAEPSKAALAKRRQRERQNNQTDATNAEK